jgi:hypothetical protein
MGAIKGVVGDACELLHLTVEEAMKMTISQLLKAIETAERDIDKIVDNQIDTDREEGWDVDVDENGPFIITDKGGI